MRCPDCDGRGRVTCRKCAGVGTIFFWNVKRTTGYGHPTADNHTCYNCDGSGEEKCIRCKGTGSIPGV